MLEKKFIFENITATEEFAKQIASVIVPDFIITLTGDLGAGKTTLTRYTLQAMGIKGPIKSPTFTLVEPYNIKNSLVNLESTCHPRLTNGSIRNNNKDVGSRQIKNGKESFSNIEIYHFDLYRFNDPEEWFYAGMDEYFSKNSICFIEWGEKALGLIPKIDWELEIIMDNNTTTKRMITIRTTTKKGEMCLKKLIQQDAI